MKKIYYKVQPKGDVCYCICEKENISSIVDWLDGASAGVLTIEVSTVEMTEEEFQALPEYEE